MARVGDRWLAVLMAGAVLVLVGVVATGALVTQRLVSPHASGGAGPAALRGPLTVRRVIDGDTVEVTPSAAPQESDVVRLVGVDTPETHDPRKPVQCFGPEAAAFTTRTLRGATVWLSEDPVAGATDRYHRHLAYLWLPNHVLFNYLLIRQGWGREYDFRGQNYRYRTAFEAAQRAAQAERRGLWSPASCGPPVYRSAPDPGGAVSSAVWLASTDRLDPAGHVSCHCDLRGAMHTVRRPSTAAQADDGPALSLAPSRAAETVGSRAPLNEDDAVAAITSGALVAAVPGPVGLELEGHLVDRDHPQQRPAWSRVRAAVDALPALPGLSTVTIEPGGQVELSTAVGVDAVEATALLAADHRVLVSSLAEHRLGVAGLGADPARPATRINPAHRYGAMETYFAAAGHEAAGRAMMCSTASLQVNLEAGVDPRQWASRVSQVHRLGPMLVALSASSPALDGVGTGWRSSRQQVWGDLDPARCAPLRGGEDPAAEWANYALCAPVMLVLTERDGVAQAVPMTTPVSFRAWLRGDVLLDDRLPRQSDLDYHLTTLFPPVRLRGFLEIRYLDAVPHRWWPGLAAITTLLMDDPVAADIAAEACEPVGGEWTVAAREGLSDPALLDAARRCVGAAAAAAPPELRDVVHDYAALVESGRSPGDEVAEALGRTEPARVLWEHAHA